MANRQQCISEPTSNPSNPTSPRGLTPSGWEESAGFRETFLFRFYEAADLQSLRHLARMLHESALEMARYAPPSGSPRPARSCGPRRRTCAMSRASWRPSPAIWRRASWRPPTRSWPHWRPDSPRPWPASPRCWSRPSIDAVWRCRAWSRHLLGGPATGTADKPAAGKVMTARAADNAAAGKVMTARAADKPAAGKVMTARAADKPAAGKVMTARAAVKPAAGKVMPARAAGNAAPGKGMTARAAGNAATGKVMPARAAGNAAPGKGMTARAAGNAATGKGMPARAAGNAAPGKGMTARAAGTTSVTEVMTAAAADAPAVVVRDGVVAPACGVQPLTWMRSMTCTTPGVLPAVSSASCLRFGSGTLPLRLITPSVASTSISRARRPSSE